MNVAQLKVKCRVIMMGHLETKGFLEMSRREILEELVPMWKLFEDEGVMADLKSIGWTFSRFKDLAIKIAQEQAIMDQFHRVGNILKRKRT